MGQVNPQTTLIFMTQNSRTPAICLSLAQFLTKLELGMASQWYLRIKARHGPRSHILPRITFGQTRSIASGSPLRQHSMQVVPLGVVIHTDIYFNALSPLATGP